MIQGEFYSSMFTTSLIYRGVQRKLPVTSPEGLRFHRISTLQRIQEKQVETAVFVVKDLLLVLTMRS